MTQFIDLSSEAIYNSLVSFKSCVADIIRERERMQITGDEDKNYVKLTDKEYDVLLWKLAHEMTMLAHESLDLEFTRNKIKDFFSNQDLNVFKVTDADHIYLK